MRAPTMPDDQFTEPSNAAQMQAAANSLPVVRWLMRAQWGVVILAVIMLFDGAVLPLFAMKSNAAAIMVPIFLLIGVTMVATFWMLARRANLPNRKFCCAKLFTAC